jgi:DNA-directed RNA polymerase subunit RPC12/RpoP
MDISFKCPTCDQELEVDASAAGSNIACPACGNAITVPVPAEALAEAPDATAEAPPKVEKHFSVPVHQHTPDAEPLIKKPANRPLEVAAKEGDKTVRIRTFKRTECVEVGRDRFDEIVSGFLAKVGQPNIISINPISYSYVELGTRTILADYGVTIVFKG